MQNSFFFWNEILIFLDVSITLLLECKICHVRAISLESVSLVPVNCDNRVRSSREKRKDIVLEGIKTTL